VESFGQFAREAGLQDRIRDEIANQFQVV
jgi:hypothetical protein